jgi:hypothetical protein
MLLRVFYNRRALTDSGSDANLFVPSWQLRAHRALLGVCTARLPAKVQAKIFLWQLFTN